LIQMNATEQSNAVRGKNAAPFVSFIGIEKAFSGLKVLKGVGFDVAPGRIVGLVGENGAGKSTLMNLLGGNLQPDAGSIRIDGRAYNPQTPNDARDAGIAFVHQELNLFPNLSIAENLHLAVFPLVGRRSSGPGRSGRIGVPWIDRSTLNARTGDLLREVGLDRPPNALVENLPAGERQLVEIARALGAEARVIIFDEPTTSLSARECDRLFALMHQLRGRGMAMIYISHALGDVLRICDELVVLRDGERVGGGPSGEFSHERLVSLMVGRTLDRLYPHRARWDPHTSSESEDQTDRRPSLDVCAVSQPGVVRDVSFKVDPGEVLGLFGLMGAGRSELARILFGLDPFASGEIFLNGRPLTGGPRDRIRAGLAFLTEDRRHEGLCLQASISDNVALPTLSSHCRTRLQWLDFARIGTAVRRMRDAVRLSPAPADSQAVGLLSGGNQQKVVLAKWLLAEPRVLVLDEPTRGIDVGAKFEIYQLIHRLADGGAGVLVISSEIEELVGICDRMLVMRHGEISGEFRRDQFDREEILAAALNAGAL
jgi:ribose transport system ATP-binding protein